MVTVLRQEPPEKPALLLRKGKERLPEESSRFLKKAPQKLF